MKTLVLATYAMALVSGGCGTSDQMAASAATVTGTLTLPGMATAPYFVQLQAMVASATPVARTAGTTNGTTSLPYSLSDVPAGTYFMIAAVDVDSSGGNSSTAGDYRGWYGHTGDGNPPATANVVVPASGTVTVDYSLVLAP